MYPSFFSSHALTPSALDAELPSWMQKDCLSRVLPSSLPFRREKIYMFIKKVISMETNLSKKIAEELENGLKVYLNSNNKDILALPDFSEFEDNKEWWQKELTELKENRKNWREVPKWSSREEFEFMQEFAENHVHDEKLQNDLFFALQKRSPFQNFKFTLGYNEKYRQKWFTFISEKHHEYTKKVLEVLIR